MHTLTSGKRNVRFPPIADLVGSVRSLTKPQRKQGNGEDESQVDDERGPILGWGVTPSIKDSENRTWDHEQCAEGEQDEIPGFETEHVGSLRLLMSAFPPLRALAFLAECAGMKVSAAAAATIFLISSASAIAADLLPLQRGIYVQAGTACKGASNAATLSYWGGLNGINDQQTGCEITNLKQDGSSYALQRNCTSVRFGGSVHDEVKVTILSRTSFVFHPSVALGLPSRTFRYCGHKVEF